MNEDNPLIRALKNKAVQEGPTVTNTDGLLQYILAHFDLVPKDAKDKTESQDVVTQESHSP